MDERLFYVSIAVNLVLINQTNRKKDTEIAFL